MLVSHGTGLVVCGASGSGTILGELASVVGSFRGGLCLFFAGVSGPGSWRLLYLSCEGRGDWLLYVMVVSRKGADHSGRHGIIIIFARRLAAL